MANLNMLPPMLRKAEKIDAKDLAKMVGEQKSVKDIRVYTCEKGEDFYLFVKRNKQGNLEIRGMRDRKQMKVIISYIHAWFEQMLPEEKSNVIMPDIRIIP